MEAVTAAEPDDEQPRDDELMPGDAPAQRAASGEPTDDDALSSGAAPTSAGRSARGARQPTALPTPTVRPLSTATQIRRNRFLRIWVAVD
ncbi:MAG: hypothetical protein KF729_39250, partial [Sandaracinaceae bacterium]|nr:hypothetical protein [Sandaracinaceae bacterium]